MAPLNDEARGAVLALNVDDHKQRCARVRALWAHVQARDWAAMRAAFASDAVMDWPCTGERLLDADAIVRANAIYPEGWSIRIVAVDALADGRVHSVVEVTHPPDRFFASSTFRFVGTQIAAVEEYWATVQTPPEWRNAATIGAYERSPPQSRPA